MTPTTIQRLLVGVALVLLVGMAWQARQIAQLRADVDGLQPELGNAQAPDAAHGAEADLSRSPVLGRPARPGVQIAPSPRPAGASNADASISKRPVGRDEQDGLPVPSLEIVDQAVQDALLRAEQARLEEQGERYLAKEQTRVAGVLDEMIAESLVDEDKRADTLDLLMGEQEEAWGLKADVQDGVLTSDEAAAEWRTIHDETARALSEMLGYETAQDLLERTSRRSK